MANITELVFILDKSGSMSGLESDTIGGFNSMLEKQRAYEGNVLVSTILFNNSSEVLHDRIPLENVEPLTEKDYFVGGSTALLDAIGDAVKHIRNVHKYARKEDCPEKTLFVITTDGYENASRKFSYGEIKKLIERQKNRGWEFVFLGANIDAVEVASSIGIERRRAVNYHADSRGTAKLYCSVGNFVTNLRASKSNQTADDSWRKDLDDDFRSR